MSHTTRNTRHYKKHRERILAVNENWAKELGVTRSFWRNVIVPRVLKAKGGKCEDCNSTENLEVHHTDYEKKTISALRVLCKKCHRKYDGRQ